MTGPRELILRPFSKASGLTALVATAALLLPLGARAQDLTLVPADETVSTMLLVSVRDGGAIEADLDAARELSERLETEVDNLQVELAEAKAQVDVKKSEIEVIKTKKDLADKQDKEAEKKAFEEEEDAEELQKRLLERHVEFIERRIDLARAQRETAGSAERVYQAELKLESTSNELNDLQSTDEGTLNQAMRIRSEYTKQEKSVLEAKRDHARKKENQAKNERRVIEAQLEIIEARNKIQAA